MKRVYMDNNATTPIRNEALEAMKPFLDENFGNPSSLHSFGRIVRKAVEESRARIAAAMNADPNEIIFTSGGTEADTIALLGATFTKNAEKRRKIILSAIEHPAILETGYFLAKRGFEVFFAPVDKFGIIDIEALKRELNTNTLIVSVMMANNEVGTIQPIEEISPFVKEIGALFHSDCVQSFGKITVDVKKLGVDMATVSSHKIYGPKGTGALFIKKGVKVESLFHGGHQERLIRPGTENTAGVIGFGKAAELIASDFAQGLPQRMASMRDEMQRKIFEKIKYVTLNGHPESRVPNTLNIGIAYVEGEGMLLSLDAKGVAISTGSACSSGSLEPSHVLTAMGVPVELAHGSLRFSLGNTTAPEDIDYAVDTLADVVARLRSMSPLYDDFIKSNQ